MLILSDDSLKACVAKPEPTAPVNNPIPNAKGFLDNFLDFLKFF